MSATAGTQPLPKPVPPGDEPAEAMVPAAAHRTTSGRKADRTSDVDGSTYDETVFFAVQMVAGQLVPTSWTSWTSSGAELGLVGRACVGSLILISPGLGHGQVRSPHSAAPLPGGVPGGS